MCMSFVNKSENFLFSEYTDPDCYRQVKLVSIFLYILPAKNAQACVCEGFNMHNFELVARVRIQVRTRIGI